MREPHDNHWEWGKSLTTLPQWHRPWMPGTSWSTDQALQCWYHPHWTHTWLSWQLWLSSSWRLTNKSSWSLRDRHFCSPSGSQKLSVVLISLKRTLTCIEQRWGLLSEPKKITPTLSVESAEYCAIYWWTNTEKLVNYVTLHWYTRWETCEYLSFRGH